jgi:WD40 repeat protein
VLLLQRKSQACALSNALNLERLVANVQARETTTISGLLNGTLQDERGCVADILPGHLTELASSPTLQTTKSGRLSCTLAYISIEQQLTGLCGRPQDLLDERRDPHKLTAYSTLPAAEPINALAIYPMFDLQDPCTTLVLSSQRDHPIRLNSALALPLVASYPLVNPTTESFVSPHALLFTADGSRFLAGSESLLSIFDIARPGEGPVSCFRTGRKRGSSLAVSGMNMTGILSALAIEQQSGILATGTFNRHVGVYDSGGQGDCIGVFCVEGTEADLQIGGSGVTQVIWSPCGRYLYIVERKSDGVMIYDIRKTGQLLGWLEERKALTNQRLGVHISSLSEATSQEVWAGGTDGMIRAWRNPHEGEGAQKASFELHGHHGTYPDLMAVSKMLIRPQLLCLVQPCILQRRYWQVVRALKYFRMSMMTPLEAFRMMPAI